MSILGLGRNCFQGLPQARDVCVFVVGEPKSFVPSTLPHGCRVSITVLVTLGAEVIAMMRKWMELLQRPHVHQATEHRDLPPGPCPQEVYGLSDTQMQIFMEEENTNFHSYTGMCQPSYLLFQPTTKEVLFFVFLIYLFLLLEGKSNEDMDFCLYFHSYFSTA